MLIFLDGAFMLCDGKLSVCDVAGKLVHYCGDGSAALLEGSNFIFQGLYLCGKGATKLDDLVNL